MSDVVVTKDGAVLEVLFNRPEKKNALMTVAREVAARLAALPPEAVRQTKRLIRHGRGDGLAPILLRVQDRGSGPQQRARQA